MTSTPPTVALDLTLTSFPMVIEYWAEATGDLARSYTIDGPGVCQIPPHPEPVTVRMVYADGFEYIVTSAGAEAEATAPRGDR